MICQDIAEQVVDHRDDHPASVTHASSRVLVDWVAALFAGAEHPATKALQGVGELLGGSGQSEVVGWRRTIDPRHATLINATAAHATEVDDIYRDGLYHPGVSTIASALAVGQNVGASGAELLRAIALGYEVSCRIAAAINPAHYRFWHTTGTVGTFGSTIAASVLLGLNQDELGHTLAIGATMAAGLQQSFRSEAMSKPLHAGHAADAGVLAVSAKNGFTGALDVLEGEAGFGNAMSENVDWSRVTRRWTEPWAVDEMTVKNHTACGHTFAPIDAMMELRDHHGVVPADVEHIVVETATIPINVAGNKNPKTEFEAKFSIAYCISAALTLGSVRLDAFAPATLEDAGLRDLVGRVELVPTEEFDAVFPEKRGARVRVQRRDGTTEVAEVWTRHGDPDDPLSDADLSSKFLELTRPLLGDGSEKLLELLWSFENIQDLSTLLRSA